MVYTQSAGTWKVMSLSTTCKVMSAWPSTSFAVDTLKMVVGAGWRWPSRSSNRCERTHIKQNWCLKSTIWCSGYIKHAPEVKPYTEDTLTSHLDLHWVRPQQQCDRPCPTYCYKDKAYGAVAGRIALGKSSGKGQKSHAGTSNFKKNFSFKFLAFIFLSRSCLTRTWRAGSRLSTGKSGRPRLDDSWEHSVVASESSWETLTHRKQHNTAWRHRPSKNTHTSVCIYLKCTFLQQHLVLLSTATPTGPENIQKKTRLKYPQSLTNLLQNTVGWEAREKENKGSIFKFQNKSKTNISF